MCIYPEVEDPALALPLWRPMVPGLRSEKMGDGRSQEETRPVIERSRSNLRKAW